MTGLPVIWRPPWQRRRLVHRVHRRGVMKLFATLAAALLVSGACGARARLLPTQGERADRPDGQPAASYELRADQTSDGRITVNVWSHGARRDGDRTFVELAVEIRNTDLGAVELDRDALSLETFNVEGTPLPAARLAGALPERGSLVVAPQTARTIRLSFGLTVPVSPTHVGALRFRWGVVRDDGERYVQFTEFRRRPELVAAAPRVHYDPIFGFYDPYFYGAPYGYHLNYYVPVRRVVVEHRGPR